MSISHKRTLMWRLNRGLRTASQPCTKARARACARAAKPPASARVPPQGAPPSAPAPAALRPACRVAGPAPLWRQCGSAAADPPHLCHKPLEGPAGGAAAPPRAGPVPARLQPAAACAHARPIFECNTRLPPRGLRASGDAPAVTTAEGRPGPGRALRALSCSCRGQGNASVAAAAAVLDGCDAAGAAAAGAATAGAAAALAGCPSCNPGGDLATEHWGTVPHRRWSNRLQAQTPEHFFS